MFGFLNPRTCNLAYRSLYARCCQHQRHNYGLLSLPTLSYEAVFLYALGLDTGELGDFQPLPRRCCLLRKDDVYDAPVDGALGNFVSSVGVLLADVKLQDDIRDSQSSPLRLARTVRHRLLASRSHQAIRHLSTLDEDFESRIVECLDDQVAMENAGSDNLDTFARPTGRAFRYLFSVFANLFHGDGYAEAFPHIGELVGQSMIAWDCAQDWESDAKRGQFNPVRDSISADGAHAFAIDRLSEAANACNVLFGRASRSAGVLASVKARLSCSVAACSSVAKQQADIPVTSAVVLNAVCCIPCGDGAIAIDCDKDCEACGQVFWCGCCGCCLGICCLSQIFGSP
jgi:hypothetical protein